MSRRRGFASLRAGLINRLDKIRESYWFWPTLMSLAAVAVAIVTSYLDGLYQLDPLGLLGVAGIVGPQSARAVLSTVASAMLGVAGVSFSILVAAFVFASGQFGPRILSNFMRDRANQVVLGIFASTFLYCIIVLRIIGDSGLPSLSVFIALLAALSSIFALFFFFHHAPESIRLTRIVANVGREIVHEMDALFPRDEQDQSAPGGDSGLDREEALRRAGGEPRPVPSPVTGYMRFVDHHMLMRIAEEEDLVIRLDRRPGDFVVEGRPLAWAWPSDRLTEDLESEIRYCFTTGASRSPAMDIEFLFELLMDVASRALSPGINDPRTAMVCLDWMSAGLVHALKGKPRSAVRCDGEGRTRLILRARHFEHLLEHGFGRVRPYFQTDPSAALHMMARIGGLLLDAEQPPHREALMRQARNLMDGVEQELVLEADRKAVRVRFEIIERVAAGELGLFEARGRHPWL